MLIVIPTYKRNQCLRWVLQSVIQSEISRIHEPVRVLIVNNYPPDAEKIKGIVEPFSSDERFEWKILYRKVTLMPVDNWYSAIFDNARRDEVVFINSDDDLLLPHSLQRRYFEINELGSDLLLSQLGGNILFSEDGQRVMGEPHRNVLCNQKSKILDIEEISSFAPQHLSNHCYRNTEKLQAAYRKAISWCQELDWLDENNRTIFLPLYLAYALLVCNGKVAGFQIHAVLRGRDLDEIASSKYGVPGWNHGFIHVCALIVLKNKDLGQYKSLDDIRRAYKREYLRWLATYFFDQRVGMKMWWRTHHETGLQFSNIKPSDILFGIGLIVKSALRLQGRKLRRAARGGSMRTEDFMVKLSRTNETD